MTIEYSYDENLASQADREANAIAEPGAYVGTFTKVHAITASTGTEGISFAFDAPGFGALNFSLYTRKPNEDKPLFGANFVSAILYLFGMKGMKSVPGDVEVYDRETKTRVTEKGDIFPDLCKQPIGLVFQQEKYSRDDGGTGTRLNLVGVYQPETKLMVSELRERKTKPIMLERLTRKLVVKDTRKKQIEPPQPTLGVDFDCIY